MKSMAFLRVSKLCELLFAPYEIVTDRPQSKKRAFQCFVCKEAGGNGVMQKYGALWETLHEDVDTTLIIHITFNQHSTFLSADAKIGIERALTPWIVGAATSCGIISESYCRTLASYTVNTTQTHLILKMKDNSSFMFTIEERLFAMISVA